LWPAARSGLANFGDDHVDLSVTVKKIDATNIKHEWLEIKVFIFDIIKQMNNEEVCR
jgi:hypothetical protein